MKRIYQLSFVLLITLLFAQCDDSEKLAKPHLSLSELQEKITTSEAFINFRATTLQNLTNSFGHIAELNTDDRHTLNGFVEKYSDVNGFTKNATKEELDEFSKLTKVVEVENTLRDIKAFESFVDHLKRDFDFNQENLSLVILEGFFNEEKIIKNQRISCTQHCTKVSQAFFWKIFSYNFYENEMPFFDAVQDADNAADYHYIGCLYGCAGNPGDSSLE